MTTLTDEQMDVLNEWHEPDNLQIIAYAGCGKSSTLCALDRAMPEAPRLYLAFNKKVVEEMEKVDKETGKAKVRNSTECRTLNSLGHRVWSKTCASKVVLNTKKTTEVFREYVKGKKKDEANQLWEAYDEIKTAVDLAKAVGYIPSHAPMADRTLVLPDEFFAKLDLDIASRNAVNVILYQSIRQAYLGNLDFNDQLYMPTLFGGSFPKYPIVFIDEAQDLSPINHHVIAKLAQSARIIAVGDPFQSIYGFRGAMQGGMERQRAIHVMKALPLSISFRCPSEIVKNARWRAKDFKWLRTGGSVEVLHSLDLLSIADGSTIICRNNAPLFRLALRLLSASRSVSMAGTDIGSRMVGILRRLGDEGLSRSSVLGAIDNWEARRAENKNAQDMADCLRLFANLGSTLAEAIAHAEYLFKQTGSILLSTGHKAKGLEWPAVYFLDSWLIGKEEQDQNLKYVIETRSCDRLFYVNSEDIQPTI